MSKSSELMGTVKFFSDEKGWGFLRAEGYDQDIFVHYKHILGDGYKSLVKNELVIFKPVINVKGIMATEVKRLT